MKLQRVKRLLGRRLAWLTAKVEQAPHNRLVEERDALDTAMRCLGMRDDEQLAHDLAQCRERVLPAEQRTVNRARRGDELLTNTKALVRALQGAVPT